MIARGHLINPHVNDAKVVLVDNGDVVELFDDNVLGGGIATLLLGGFSPLHLTFNAVVDSIQDGVDGRLRLVGRLSAVLVDARLDKDGVPLLLALSVHQVGTPNVRLGSIPDEVHRLRSPANGKAMLVGPPLLQQPGGKLERTDLGLAEGVCYKLLAPCDRGEGVLNNLPQGTHAQTGVLVACRPQDVVVAEVDWRRLLKGLGASLQAAALGHGNVQNDLQVTGPVAAISEDKDGFDDDVLEITTLKQVP
ncbi:hypothetical protein FJTKL_10657 [Diaporthe vaccinii]|uniref:Uncharacterized protein n=1 Tax=Diaporthe vaccinii TaxID=105482 RepID=A0ABR4FB84_9PEZI